MGTPSHACPRCGTAAAAGVKFCGQCGYDFVILGRPPQPAPEPAPEPPPPAPEPLLAQAPQPAPPESHPKRTMLGMPVVDRAAVGAPPVFGAAIPAPQAEAAHHARPAGTGREQRTMLGMTAPPSGQAAVASPAVSAPPTSAVGPSPAAPAGPTQRTMLGMPLVPDPVAAPPPAQPEAQKVHVGPSQRTMLGMPQQRRSDPPAAPAHPPRQRTPVQYGVPVDKEGSGFAPSDSYSLPRRGPPVGLIVGVLAVLALGAIAAAAVVWWVMSGSDSDVLVAIVQGEQGETLRIEVPDAPTGSKVRFSGQELPLVSGVATFPLAVDALRVGDNEVLVDVVAPDGTVDRSRLTLTVSFRVRADLSGLDRDPPSISIVIDAIPEARMLVEGQPVTLGSDGRAALSYPLPQEPSTQPVFEHVVRYRAEIPGQDPQEGTVRTRIPFVTLQIDRPGTNVVTDRAVTDIAGMVDPEATVSIDGTAVAINEGRFLHRFPLPEPRTYEPHLVARRAGLAPRVLTLTIRRVANLAAEAASFTPDPDMSYARIQQNPSIYRGQRIILDGRVYAVNVQAGRTEIQMLVRDCPRGQRCPVWISHPAALDITSNTWVRVFGTVAGEQQFRSETDRVITVPHVDATYVLPAQP